MNVCIHVHCNLDDDRTTRCKDSNCRQNAYKEFDLEWIPRIGEEITFTDGGWEAEVRSVQYCTENGEVTIHAFCRCHEHFASIISEEHNWS